MPRKKPETISLPLFHPLKVDYGSRWIRKRDASPPPPDPMATFGRLQRLAHRPHSLYRKPTRVVPCLSAVKHKSLEAVFFAEKGEGFSASCGHQSLALMLLVRCNYGHMISCPTLS